MDVSVVIPAYNYARFVGRAIASVMEQSGGEFEAIVVDDGSTDDTPVVLEQYLQQYPGRLHCVRQANAGVSAARNRGIDLARGEFVVFLDADDQLLPGGLGLLLAAAGHNPAADLIIGGSHIDYGRKVRQRFNERLPEDRKSRFLASLNNEIDIRNGCFMVRRQVLDGIRFSDNLRNMEDPVFRGLLFANVEAISIREPVVACYRHAGSLRYDTGSQLEAVDRAVSALFDHPMMPPQFAFLRQQVSADYYLGIYRRLATAGRIREACEWYKKAFRLSPRAALKFTYLSKFLRGLVKKKSNNTRADSA